VKGALIAFEGLDQSGKETQARRLRAVLEEEGHGVVSVTFPCYQTAIAQEIALALRGEREYAPDVLQLLFIANRYEYRQQMRDWSADGKVILCDRYVASSVAYGEAHGLDPGWLTDAQRTLPQPDLTIFIDIAPQTAASRKQTGRDRFERDLALLDKVRASYARQATAPGWYRVDGERSVDTVAADISRIVRQHFDGATAAS
jgi:dTMP kinase